MFPIIRNEEILVPFDPFIESEAIEQDREDKALARELERREFIEEFEQYLRDMDWQRDRSWMHRKVLVWKAKKAIRRAFDFFWPTLTFAALMILAILALRVMGQ